MAWWTQHVVPRLAHRALDNGEVAELRRRVVADLHGRVLELGFGSGLNLPLLPPGVRALDAVDPSDVAWEISASARTRSTIPVERVGRDAQQLAAGDDTYDAVLVTFTLCTVPDPGRTLAEAGRVLRPGGALHFLEHGAEPRPRVARWQRRLDPVQQALAGGCHLTRDASTLLSAAGFEVTEVQARRLGPVPGLAYITTGRAVPT